jgi:fused signal recognition particle receptor
MFNRFVDGLRKTRSSLTRNLADIGDLFGGDKKPDKKILDELEEALILADVGAAPAREIIEELGHYRGTNSPREILAGIIAGKLNAASVEYEDSSARPFVVLVVGVNGSGKTTTIARIGHMAVGSGKGVVIAAADTFRAAAGEQLEYWAGKIDADLVRGADGSDPASVAFDAVKAATTRNLDLVLIDTAGRLQTRYNLMEELKKIKRVIDKAMPGAPHEILMVMDATTGQNGLSQIETFNQAVGITSLALVKLDGSAKGGVLVAAADRFKIPIKYVGVGEREDDLLPFDPAAFANALVGIDE